MKQTLAIFSPNQNAYSETFIQAHKQLSFNIKFYHGGNLPTKLEKGKDLFQFSFPQKIRIRTKNHFSLSEHALMNSLKREKVDCVLAEYGPTAVHTLKVVKHLNLPLVVHFFGYDASVKTVIHQYKEQYKKVFEYATNVVVVSKQMKEDLIRMGCPLSKLVLIYCAPDNIFFSASPQFKKQQFLSIGRFVDKKAPYLTIAAFSKVVHQFPDTRLLMIGDGLLLNTCKNLAKLWGIERNVDFPGTKSPSEILCLFEESTAFVQHSITALDGDSEGTPVAVLDAQAAALPVLSTFHAGIPDIIIDGETGFLVKEQDVDGMARYMIKLMEEKGLAKKMGEAGRKRTSELFSMEKCLNKLNKVIFSSMGNSSTLKGEIKY